MSNPYKATGKLSSLVELYDALDEAFKRHVDQIIDKKEGGHCLLRLLRLPQERKTQTPTKLLKLLLKKFRKDEHHFVIKNIHLNVTLEDILYLTGLPIHGKAVTSTINRDKTAFARVFRSFDTDKEGNVTLLSLKKIVITSEDDKERLTALLLAVIICFVAPKNDKYVVDDYLVQFVENLKEVDSYAWGAALLARFYHSIENNKKTVDANCWPLLAFFCIRIPKLCEALGFSINLENKHAPLLENCLTAMQKFSVDKRNDYTRTIKTVLADLKDEEIKWHPYDDKMLDDRMRPQLPFVTLHAPVIYMNFVAYHRPLSHLKQFRGHEEYVGKRVDWNPRPIKFVENKGDNNQNFEEHYHQQLELWKNGEPVEKYIRKKLKLDDSSPLSGDSFEHSPQSQSQQSTPKNLHPSFSHSYQNSSDSHQDTPQCEAQHSTQTNFPPSSSHGYRNSSEWSPQVSHNTVRQFNSLNTSGLTQSRNSYRTPQRNRPTTSTVTRTFAELLAEQERNGVPSYYDLEDAPASYY